MHVLWTPSWYPSAESPNNGSFFLEQLEMLHEGGLQCGVIWIETRSLGQRKPPLTVDSGNIPLVRAGVWLVPHGILPLDRFFIARKALQAARAYEAEFGVPDVIHAHSVWPGIIVAQTLSKYWGIPYGLTEHRPSSLEAPKHTARAKMIQTAVNGAAFYSTVSEGMNEQLSAYYGVQDVQTVALPVRDAFFVTPVHRHTGEQFTFTHISNLDENKRTDFTLETFALFHQQFPEARMLIVGGAPQRVKELESKVADLGIAEVVQFTGQVDRSEIISVFNQADCMILVSALEAGGTVFAEATSLGIPSIASNTFGGSFMVTEENGIVIEVDDQLALMKAMAKVRQRYQLEPQWNQQIRAVGEKRFSAATFVSSTSGLYAKAISGKEGETVTKMKEIQADD